MEQRNTNNRVSLSTRFSTSSFKYSLIWKLLDFAKRLAVSCKGEVTLSGFLVIACLADKLINCSAVGQPSTSSHNAIISFSASSLPKRDWKNATDS